jgi:hypothetical protein
MRHEFRGWFRGGSCVFRVLPSLWGRFRGMTTNPDSQQPDAAPNGPIGEGSSPESQAFAGPALSSERAAELGQRLVASLFVPAKNSGRSSSAERAIAERLAREHPGQALTEPILKLLVARLLKAQLRIDVERSKTWMAAIATIAGSLWDDPSARARVERLWQSCSETTQRAAQGGSR